LLNILSTELGEPQGIGGRGGLERGSQDGDGWSESASERISEGWGTIADSVNQVAVNGFGERIERIEVIGDDR
jgi:hypothetical protein